MGHATTFYDGPFAPETALAFIKDEGITNLAGAPTAFRLLMTAKTQSVEAIKGQLRAVSSAGEPLNPEVIKWFAERLEAPVLDHYGQTEIGMVVCNHHGLQHPVKPGTAGYAMPGYRMAVVEESGDAVRVLGPDQPGILAVDRAASPLYFFPGYWQQATPAFRGGYYLTGDTVEMAADGRVTFVGRSDDIITSSGYRIGPFEVESCLIEHPAVMEAAVVGRPDPQRTEIVKAFVVLRAGFKPNADTVDALQTHVKTRLAAHAYPREIAFVDALPKTPSGKIQRFLLRQQT
jgi:acetyl-CoA synthetase